MDFSDAEDDLPDDFVGWNIPLSPRPFDSRSPSPERTGRPVRPTLRSAASRKSYLASSRNPSWSAALSDLADEVQVLTERLEVHADTLLTDSSGPLTRPPLQKRAKTCQLPPVQRQSIMVDPLPISKEKEKMLTRTRPSWLPPKSKKEEEKHVRQYQKMMAKFDKTEDKKFARQESVKKTKEVEAAMLEKTWSDRLACNAYADFARSDTRELCWRGIPASTRGHAWSRAIGNNLELSSKSYAAAAGRALSSRQRHVESGLLAAIYKDILLAFPSLALFQPNCPRHQPLLDLLTAHASYCSDNYAPGTASVAALLMLTPSRADASAAATFIVLENLLNRPMLRSLTLPDTSAKTRTHATLLMSLADELPRLHAHLTKPELALEPAAFLDRACASLLTLSLGSHAAAQRVWDVLVFEGDAGLVAAVVALLKRHEKRLYGSKEEILAVLGCAAKAGNVPDTPSSFEEDEQLLADLKAVLSRK